MTTHHRHIPQEQLQRLRAVHKGPVFLQTDQQLASQFALCALSSNMARFRFLHHSRIWNGSIINQAVLLAQPRSAEDVTQ
jgi:hypothetical protein